MTSFKYIVNAFREGKPVTLEEFITNVSELDINKQDEYGDTLLHMAGDCMYYSYLGKSQEVIERCRKIVSYLAKNADCGLRNKDGRLAVYRLFILAADCSEEFVTVLDEVLSSDGVKEECWKDGQTLLHFAVKLMKWDLVRAIFSISN